MTVIVTEAGIGRLDDDDNENVNQIQMYSRRAETTTNNNSIWRL